MGEDRQALTIYVFKIQDYAKAEEYVKDPQVLRICHFSRYQCLNSSL